MRHDVERYLQIRNATGASVGHEGDLMAFLLDTTGVPQVWTVEGPGQWPEQRTYFDERVTFVTASPSRPEVVFGMDAGGNERQQFHRLDVPTGGIEPLTAHPDAKHLWGGWSTDGERFAFASNRRDEGTFDVYVQARGDTGEDARLVYESSGWYTPAGWSPADDRLVIHEARSNFDQDVHVLDVETGTLRTLTDAPERRYLSPEWGPHGEFVYLVTDEDADSLCLARIDVASGGLEVLRTGGDWNVDGVAIDQDTGRLVFSRNVDGSSNLVGATIDASGELAERAELDIPDGVAGGVSFFPDARRFAFTLSTRTRNPNVHVADMDAGEVTAWTDASRAGIPPASFQAPELIRYESFDGREIPALFTRPDGVDGAVPVIVDIHGGPESQRRPSFSAVQQYLLQHGYALLEPNVRGSSGYGRQYLALDDVERRWDAVKDVGAALDWLEGQRGVDADRVVAFGGSYGGFMVLASMIEFPDRWAAGIDIVGIANFVTFLRNTGPWRRALREAEYGGLEDDPELLQSISPINRADEISAPLFVLHGANDPRVPVGEAEQIAEAVAAQDIPVRTLIFEDEGHGFAKEANRIEAYSAIADFLEGHV